jgi:hypothetical protein
MHDRLADPPLGCSPCAAGISRKQFGKRQTGAEFVDAFK